MDFAADSARPETGGDITLRLGDTVIGVGRMAHTVPQRFSAYAGFDIGRDNGGVVDRSYEDRAPYAFTGIIHKVVFDLHPHINLDDEAALEKHAAHGDLARNQDG